MKLANFEVQSAAGPVQRVGVLTDDDTLLDVTAGVARMAADDGKADPESYGRTVAPPTLIEFISQDDAFDTAQSVRSRFGTTTDETSPNGSQIAHRLSDVRVRSPVSRPNSIRDFSTFEEHIAKSPRLEAVPEPWYELPVYYKGNPDSVVHPGDEVQYPANESRRDYELEVAAIVGKQGREIDPADASEYIAGFTIFNDFSARDVQMQEMTIGMGPSFGKDFANGFGPYLVTPDAFDVEGASMTARVNGEIWSEGTLDEMYHSFEDIVTTLSETQTLYPGDVLGTGTPGSGCGLGIDRFLEPGDTVELSVEGIGTLRNVVGSS